jgi:hypothetical protein
MVRVSVNGVGREAKDADVPWLKQQIEQRRGAGEPICIRVEIQFGSLTLNFATAGCGGGGGGSTNFSPTQQEIINHWQQHRLGESDFEVGQLNAFLKKIRQYW